MLKRVNVIHKLSTQYSQVIHTHWDRRGILIFVGQPRYNLLPINILHRIQVPKLVPMLPNKKYHPGSHRFRFVNNNVENFIWLYKDILVIFVF